MGYVRKRLADVLSAKITNYSICESEINDTIFSKYPCLDLIDKLDISVKLNERNFLIEFGACRPCDRTIILNHNSIYTWFHELSHLIDVDLNGKKVMPNSMFEMFYGYKGLVMEIVADMSANFMLDYFGLNNHLTDLHSKYYTYRFYRSIKNAPDIRHVEKRINRVTSFIVQHTKGL